MKTMTTMTLTCLAHVCLNDEEVMHPDDFDNLEEDVLAKGPECGYPSLLFLGHVRC